MAKQYTRALRRHHVARLKRNRRFYHGRDLFDVPRHLGMAVTTAAPCSCHMCGNPRKHFHALTVQERRQLQAFGDE